MKKLLLSLLFLPSLSLAGDVVFRQGSGGGTVSVVSSTASGSGNSILNQNTLQDGATMYVSSGTFKNRLISLSLFNSGVYGLSGQGTFYGLDGAPTLYVNDEESGIGVDPFFTQNITLYAGLQPVLTVEGGAVAIQNSGFHKFMDGDNTHYYGLRSSNTLTTSNIYTLPASSGAANTALVLDGHNNYEHKGVILNQNTLQTGATFYVRAGVVQNGGIAFSLDGTPSTITVRAGAISAARTILVPNASGTIAVAATSPIALSGTGTISITSPLPIANGGTNNTLAYTDNSIVISNGSSLTHDVTGLNYESATDSLGVGATAASSAFIKTGSSKASQASINVGKGTAPSVPNDGDVWFTTDTNSFQTYSSDMVSPTMSVVNVSTSDTQASNIATEVTLSSHTLGTKAFAANGSTAGKLIQIHAWGHYSTDAISAPDITFRIYVGTQVVGTVTTTLPTGLSKEQWSCYLNGVVRTTGTSGTFMSNGKCEYYDGTSYVGLPIVTDTAYNINWNNAQNISITGQFSAADTDNIVKATTFWWEYAY